MVVNCEKTAARCPLRKRLRRRRSSTASLLVAALRTRVRNLTSSPSVDDDGDGGTLITWERHRRHVRDALAVLRRFEMFSRGGLETMDLAAEELRLAVGKKRGYSSFESADRFLSVL